MGNLGGCLPKMDCYGTCVDGVQKSFDEEEEEKPSSTQSRFVDTSNSYKDKRTLLLAKKNQHKSSSERRCDLRHRSSVLFPGEEQETNPALELFDFVGYDFMRDAFESANKEIDALVDHIVGTTMSSNGFVTFTELSTASFASCVLLTHKPFVLEVQPAPEPRDLVWKNLHIDRSVTRKKTRLATIFFILGALLWSIPLTAIQALSSAESLSNTNGMEWIMTAGGGSVATFINGYLPVVLLLGLIMVLPIIFEWVAINYEHRKSNSDIQESILGRYFYYQLANIYITVTAGSIWDSLSEIVDDPASILVLLGTSLPTVVGYFISLLITKTLAGLPMVLLRFGELGRFSLLRLFFEDNLLTQRELDQVYRPREILYGWEYPTQLLVIIICFTYACISPIILLFGALYFSCALVVYKKQVLYVYTPNYESGGKMFPTICYYTLLGLTMSQVTFLGYLILKQGYFEPIVILPLPFYTLWKNSEFMSLYNAPSNTISLERARELDSRFFSGEPGTPSTISLHFSQDSYRQPVLTKPPILPLSYRAGKTDEVTEYVCDVLNDDAALSRSDVYRMMRDDTNSTLEP